MDTDLLIKEIERYLAAVALFRQLGHEPKWVSEETGWTEWDRLRKPPVSRLS